MPSIFTFNRDMVNSWLQEAREQCLRWLVPHEFPPSSCISGVDTSSPGSYFDDYGGPPFLYNDPTTHWTESTQLYTWWKNNVERRNKFALLHEDSQYSGTDGRRLARGRWCAAVLHLSECIRASSGNNCVSSAHLGLASSKLKHSAAHNISAGIGGSAACIGGSAAGIGGGVPSTLVNRVPSPLEDQSADGNKLRASLSEHAIPTPAPTPAPVHAQVVPSPFEAIIPARTCANPNPNPSPFEVVIPTRTCANPNPNPSPFEVVIPTRTCVGTNSMERAGSASKRKPTGNVAAVTTNPGVEDSGGTSSDGYANDVGPDVKRFKSALFVDVHAAPPSIGECSDGTLTPQYVPSAGVTPAGIGPSSASCGNVSVGLAEDGNESYGYPNYVRFPHKLYDMLCLENQRVATGIPETATSDTFGVAVDHQLHPCNTERTRNLVVRWLPSCRGFQVLDMSQFVSTVLPLHFKRKP